jgi:glycosidase
MITSPRAVGMEFHVSRRARDRYQFDQTLFSLTGNVIFANFRAARVFAQKMNEKRDLVSFPEQAMRAGQLIAMGLIDEILHYVTGLYRQQLNPQIMHEAMEWLTRRLGAPTVMATLRAFTDAFPPVAVYQGRLTGEAYLAGETDGVPHTHLVMEELLMLWVANANPAFAPFLELFDDAALKHDTGYLRLVDELTAFFETKPSFGPEHQPLVAMLRAPAIAVPHSLTGQLEFILARWGRWGGFLSKYLYRLLSGLDLIKEEEKAIFLGPGPSLVYDFSALEHEYEHFSPDKEWMPHLVLLAKNAYVWLDQLTKQYRRPITRLDEIPDEELDRLAQRGFSGLWLIGLWERSRASQLIKQWCGNPDAVASAYSLKAYHIAHDLGGPDALARLRERAWTRGIRLASDMVPNHMGIDSEWVLEHPDWFVGLDYSPFPSYTFSGVSVSGDDRVGIYLEDHYYSRDDAAVVFKRVDHATGATRYIYHGNDGTSMPWNDTAQLNYLIPAVREAVIQTILDVARQFPIIRFDAAMTLAKKHYQRLWFPEPGTGGAIPSRAEHGLTKPHFNAVFPKEFWREVVDRVAAEVPDTLLLAEAFWLMEGYFVRTLGMHRVYNSAFMNMLRDEDNGKYRQVIKNTVEFDPEVLKRYVNFMNNPDERTAIDQFGTGDKYFGVCIVMATMPGLPMFGHGQVEGFTEKYGMEYRRAYWDEQPNAYLIHRHERDIFPLLHRRHIFAGVENFLLYDFYTAEGHVNEDVFAYSNRCGDDAGLVLFHNRFAATSGWINTSAAFAVKGPGGERHLAQRCLGEGLGAHNAPHYFTIFREHTSGLEYIRSSQELCEKGLFIELSAYQYSVFVDFREVADNEWRHYAHLADYLQGRGVPSIDEAMREVFLRPIHTPFKELVHPGLLAYLNEALAAPLTAAATAQALDDVAARTTALLREVAAFTGGTADLAPMTAAVRDGLARLLALSDPDARWSPLATYPLSVRTALGELWTELGFDPRTQLPLAMGWLAVHALGEVLSPSDGPEQSRAWMDEWQLGRILTGTLQDLGLDDGAAWRAVLRIGALTTHQHWLPAALAAPTPLHILEAWLQDPDIQHVMQINRHQEVLWFNKECFEELLADFLLVALLSGASSAALAEVIPLIKVLAEAAGRAEYRVEALLTGTEEEVEPQA